MWRQKDNNRAGNVEFYCASSGRAKKTQLKSFRMSFFTFVRCVRPFKYYKVGDCIFEDTIEVESLDSQWMFNCGFTEMNSTTGILTGDMIKQLYPETGFNETEWNLKFINFKGTIEYHSKQPPNPNAFILSAKDFSSVVYTQERD